MKDRIKQLMDAQHMNQQTFAQLTGIGAASLSSIFNGRTRPTLMHVEAIQKRFPNINLNWLLTGDGGMFVPAGSAAGDSAVEQDLFGDMSDTAGTADARQTTDKMSVPTTSLTQDSQPQQQISSRPQQPTMQRSHSSQTANRQMGFAMQVNGTRKITEIRVFYDDQTWESFVPKK